MTYIVLDTCVIVDCAYSRNEKSNPSLLDKMLDLCERDGVKLLLPEVVLAELRKADREARDAILGAVGELEREVSEIAKGGVLRGKYLDGLRDSIRDTKKGIAEEADREISKIHALAEDQRRAEVLPITHEDVVEAVRMALAAERPSKSKGSWGLVQGDCLIVAAVERFVRCHADSRVVLCSSNVTDFAAKGGSEPALHPDVAGRLANVVYYADPVACIEGELEIQEAEREEIERLGEAYERVSGGRVLAENERMAAVLREVAEASTKLWAEYEEEHANLVSAYERLDEARKAVMRQIDPSDVAAMERALEERRKFLVRELGE